ncbi:MAG: hypothetical protein PHT91_00050 [Candidatus Nanoarchaeia archaeon]|nr:hypothetical protein [Candidatus Nanoarchaeia archaeon]MDD5054144.1 hypothetical protein [Candidatus Nanoarchaeia archaeon]MDD5499255.1 hypothetical protein [Candidatus Nanoarchaeia archaeon]
MIVQALGLIDILAGIFCLFHIFPPMPIIFASILMLKGLYSIIISANIFSPFGLIDLIASSAFFLSISGFQTGIFLNIMLFLVLLKGASSMIAF